ncbi:LPS translocon maturation chaperone LptM [Hydromonas duriensis]
MRTVIQRWLLCAVATLLCVACGYRGPLYMPDATPLPSVTAPTSISVK